MRISPVHCMFVVPLDRKRMIEPIPPEYVLELPDRKSYEQLMSAPLEGYKNVLHGVSIDRVLHSTVKCDVQIMI